MPKKQPQIEPELADAILGMPQEEKDKLLMRLLRKESTLLEQLRTRFLRSDSDVVAARDELLKDMAAMFTHPQFERVNHTPGLIMMTMRDYSGAINRHVKATKDKIGEVLLLLKLVETPLTHNLPLLMQERRRSEKFAEYCCRKTQIALGKLDKLGADHPPELNVLAQRVLTLLSEYPPTANRMAEYELPGA